MDKLDLQTPNFTNENIQKLSELFPNCVSEDSDGKTIDFDLLKQELSNHIVEGNKERYELSWPGKAESLVTANIPINKTLRPNRAESKGFDNTENLYIEGDNLEALKLLQETYLGKVKMIYIDPPYNTGNDFIYKDNFSQNKSEYDKDAGNINDEYERLITNPESHGRYHSDWLSMMYPRLKLAKDLLKESGIIFISISDAEAHNLRKICDEIFGENNFLSDIIWNSTKSVTNTAIISTSHTHNLVYFKDANYYVKNREEFRLPEDGDGFDNPDNDPRGPWKADPFQVGGWRPNQQYDIKNPKTGEIFKPNSNSSWKNDHKKFIELMKDERIIFGVSGNSGPQRKRFLNEAEARGKVSKTLWDDIETTTNGTQTIKNLFDGLSVFSNPKPISLIKRMIQLSNLKNEYVLDFFAGSSSTAHAVIQLNAEDGGERKFIMAQIPEVTDEESEAYKAGYKTIAEIGKERIRRAGEKIKEDNSEKENIDNLDIGFRVLKVDSSNMKDVYFTPDQTNQSNILDLASNIKEDRSSEDLLFMVLLSWGIDLAAKIEKKDIGGKEVYFVDDNYLAACFDENIDEHFVKALIDDRPLKVVLRDSSFASSSVKINVEQIFVQANIEAKVI